MESVGPVLLLNERLSDESARRISAFTQRCLDEASRLRAEIDAFTKARDDYWEPEITRLRAEVEALRADAERRLDILRETQRPPNSLRFATAARVFDELRNAARAAQGETK